jgi:HlyD family secretion protein
MAVPVAAAGFAAIWMFGPASQSGTGMVYDTVPVSKGQIRKIVSTSGPVRALVTVSVGSQLSGQVDEVRVDFNSEVKPGDVLATIDAKTFAAKVEQAKADLAAAEAALANQQAVMNKSKAVLQAAETNVARQQGLAEKKLSPQLTYETALRDRDVAKADIAVADAQVASARATIQQRQAALDQATIDLERADIKSPIDGTVISRTVDPGQTVAASLQAPELFKIAQDLSRIRIEAQVNEADVGAVTEDNAATFTVDAYPDRQFEGRVTQVRLAATEINSVVTYTVIIEAANEGRKLFPGMTANVVILSATRDGVLRISNDALRFKPKFAAADAQNRRGDRGTGGGGDRSGRMLERLTKPAKTRKALSWAAPVIRARSARRRRPASSRPLARA